MPPNDPSTSRCTRFSLFEAFGPLSSIFQRSGDGKLGNARHGPPRELEEHASQLLRALLSSLKRLELSRALPDLSEASSPRSSASSSKALGAMEAPSSGSRSATRDRSTCPSNPGPSPARFSFQAFADPSSPSPTSGRRLPPRKETSPRACRHLVPAPHLVPRAWPDLVRATPASVRRHRIRRPPPLPPSFAQGRDPIRSASTERGDRSCKNSDDPPLDCEDSRTFENQVSSSSLEKTHPKGCFGIARGDYFPRLRLWRFLARSFLYLCFRIFLRRFLITLPILDPFPQVTSPLALSLSRPQHRSAVQRERQARTSAVDPGRSPARLKLPLDPRLAPCFP